MNSTEIMVFKKNFSGYEVNAKRIPKAIPAKDKDIPHCPSMNTAGLCLKFLMCLRQFFNCIHPIGSYITASTRFQKPTNIIRDHAESLFKHFKFGLGCQRTSHTFRKAEKYLNDGCSDRFIHSPTPYLKTKKLEASLPAGASGSISAAFLSES